MSFFLKVVNINEINLLNLTKINENLLLIVFLASSLSILDILFKLKSFK